MTKYLPVLQLGTLILLSTIAFFIWPLSLFLTWVLGVGIGLALLWGDEFFFSKWYQDKTISAGSHQLMTRSVLFLLVLVPLSLFVVTSTGSPIGWGIVSSLLLGIGWELWLLRSQVEAIKNRFFSLAPAISVQTMQAVPLIWLGVTLTVLLIIFL